MVIDFLWIIVIFLLCIDVIFLIQFLRAGPRTTKRLLGLLSDCLITLIALVGLIYIQVHSIDAFESDIYFLFFAALFVEQVIAQWTLNDLSRASPSHIHLVRWLRGIMTGFVIAYTLFALVAATFHL